MAAEKATFVAWLNENGHTPEYAAELLSQLKQAPDPRVQMRALELETRIRGFFDEGEPGARGVSIHVHIGIPVTRDVPRRVVEAAPAQQEPKP